jgi:hypothetical protein
LKPGKTKGIVIWSSCPVLSPDFRFKL